MTLYLDFKSPFATDAEIVRFHGEERLSSPFFFTVELRSDKPALTASTVVGKNAAIVVGAESGPRHINGVVTRFTQVSTSARDSLYVAELRPWFWMLTLTRNSRMFQNKTTPEILDAVFGAYGFQKSKKSLSGTYAPREYCVQHQESDFAFASRLMEDEGIFYYFEHTESDHTLVLCDDSASLQPCPQVASPKINATASGFDSDVITQVLLQEQVIPTSYVMADYNFEVPATKLKAEASGATPKLEIYEYPGHFMKKDEGDARVRHRIESVEEPAKLISGQSRIRGLISGFKLKITDHTRSDLNGEFVIQKLTHSGDHQHYENSFEGFPAATPYRPPVVTHRPVIAGSQTAKVVGKSGEEIWTDKYGRVKVQFPWDRDAKGDENSSCWVRVAQNWAGKQWGTWFLPRIGQEVIVTFIDGDPDRPLITGAVYNGEQTVPYALPGKQTVSTMKSNSSKGGGGFNEFRFEDEKDKEEIYLHAQKDFHAEVLNDVKWTITNKRETTISKADDILTVSKGNRTTKVETGNDTLEVKGTRSVTVEGDETHTNKANFTHEVEGNYSLKVKGNLTFEVTGKIEITAKDDIAIAGDKNLNTKAGMAVSNEAGTEYTNKAGTKLTNKAGTDLMNEGGMNLTNKAGIALKNEATMVEVKASASGTVDGGGMLNVKGGLVKIN